MNWSSSESLAKRTLLTGTRNGSSPESSISISKPGRSITKNGSVGASRARPESMASSKDKVRWRIRG